MMKRPIEQGKRFDALMAERDHYLKDRKEEKEKKAKKKKRDKREDADNRRRNSPPPVMTMDE